MYTKGCDKIAIRCPDHGVFWQLPSNHLAGQGCPLCRGILIGNLSRKGKDEFIKAACSLHQDKYDYSDVVYKNNKTKISIKCPQHGTFFQSPEAHLSGQWCPLCAIDVISSKNRKSVDQFISEANEIHRNKYDYSLVVYKNNHVKVKIICPLHGIFYQTALNHLLGHGCPYCSHHVSKWEQKLFEFVKSLYPDTIGSYCGWYPGRPQKEMDIFIPSLKIGFECNGIYWHKIFEDNDCSDKVREAAKLGIKLYILWDNISIAGNKTIIRHYINTEKENGK